MNPTFLRGAAAAFTALGAAAGVISSNRELLQIALPPSIAAAITVTSLVIVAVLHELAHNTAPAATAPADPAPPKEFP